MSVITTNYSLSPFSSTPYTVIKPYGFLTLLFFNHKEYMGLTVFLEFAPKTFSLYLYTEGIVNSVGTE
jgi:hypothetical protein